MQDAPADAKFIVLGSNLPPATSGIAGSFNATFSITVNYQSKGAPVQGVEDTFTSTQAVTFTTSKVVELPTRALRVLTVPMAAALDAIDQAFRLQDVERSTRHDARDVELITERLLRW